MEIRLADPGDTADIERVVAAAFEEPLDGRVAGLLRALLAAHAVQTSLVAVDSDEIVGHVQLSRSWLDPRERLVDVVVLSPLSVAPARQRAGIGGALVHAAVAAAEQAGEPAVFLEGSPDYYGRLGFQAATPLGFERPSTRIPEPAFQVVLLPSYEPWMTGRLVYCDPFWVTDCVGLRDPYLAEVEERVRTSAR